MFAPGGPLPTPQQFKEWIDTQSWLYTRREDFGEFDLSLEYWTKTTGNSGVSIRDISRAKRITLNGRVVAEHAGDPQRPKVGPIGLQLHDQFSIIMFRNVRIREIGH